MSQPSHLIARGSFGKIVNGGAKVEILNDFGGVTHLMQGGSGGMHPPRKILDPLKSLLVQFQGNIHVTLS